MRLDAAQRKASATFGGDRFPMPDKAHAEMALEDLPKAKDVSPAMQALVKARAHRILSGG